MSELPAADHQARRRRLHERLADAGCDALLVSHLPDVRYLSGFTGSAGRMLVTAGGDDVLVTDGRYREQVAAEVGDLSTHFTRGDAWLTERLTAGAVLGIDSAHVSWQQADDLEQTLTGLTLRPEPGHVAALRAIKDDAELARLVRASGITAAVLADAVRWIAPGLSERDVAWRLVREFVDAGADDRAFAPIVAAGEHGARPHHRPGTRRLVAGDLITIDCGALVDGYHADCTRVYALGEPAAELTRLVTAVRDAQAAGRAAVADGTQAGEVDAACTTALAEAGYGDDIAHPAGHAIGLEVHEEPVLRPGSTARLRERMMVTVEPGVYRPGLGGARIEDLVAVTAAGCDVLTQLPTDLMVI